MSANWLLYRDEKGAYPGGIGYDDAPKSQSSAR
jgi:hypothetical protein